MKDGFGIDIYPNEEYYSGEFKNGLREGYGIEYFFDDIGGKSKKATRCVYLECDMEISIMDLNMKES